MPGPLLLAGQLGYISHDSRAPETVVEADSLGQTQFLITSWLEEHVPSDSLLLLTRDLQLALVAHLLHPCLDLLKHADQAVLACLLLLLTREAF